MHQNLNVRLNKIAILPDGLVGDVLLGHEVKGTIINNIEIGKPIEILRYETNGIQKLGLFTSSSVQKVEGNIIYTKNSVYRMEIL